MTVRLLHFSDIHVPPHRLVWRGRELLGKSLTGWVNVRVFRRASRFQQAVPILQLLRQHIRDSQPEAVLFSGDATHLAFASEFARVGELLPAVLPGCQYLAVPGNHDYYTRHAVREARFESCFAAWQTGLRIGSAPYPFAQRVGDHWLIALNSCTANRLPIDASGQIGTEQLDRLRLLNQQLGPGRRILVTHYPLRGIRAQLEHRLRRLRDYADAAAVAQEIGVSLWLHGHIHTPFYLTTEAGLPFPTICNGSTTQRNRWSFHEYLLSDNVCQATRYQFDPGTVRFQVAQRFELALSP